MFDIKLIFYGLSSMLQFSEFVWALRSAGWDVFNNFLLIDATDKSKISGDQKRFFIALSLYPLSFFANTPFKILVYMSSFTTLHVSIIIIFLNFYYESFNNNVFKIFFLNNTFFFEITLHIIILYHTHPIPTPPHPWWLQYNKYT